MSSAVFFDVDGTLWDESLYIPESTREAIKRLHENGHYAFICTGRAKAFLKNEDLLSLGFDGIVASCGCHVEVDGKVIYEKLMTKEEAKELLETVREYKFRPVLEGPDNLYFEEKEFPIGDEFADWVRAEIGDEILSIDENYGNWKANKISCDTNIPLQQRDECFRKLKNDYEILAHNEAVCELVPAGHSKATGLEKACKAVGVRIEDSYAIGDSVNDIDMLRFAGTGIAMGNGTMAAKDAADYITASLKEDGIKKALEHFGLI